MAGRPKSNASSESASPTSGDTSSSEYELTIHHEPLFTSYSNDTAKSVVYRGVLKYGDLTLMDDRSSDENDIIERAKRLKFANEVKLGNVPPKVIKLEED
jgi:phage terminase large subunit-like protein